VVQPVVPERRVVLRDWRGKDNDGGGLLRFLEAYLDVEGNLHIDGQDIGGAAHLISDGEYEWFQEIAAADVPAFRALLDVAPEEDLLDALESRYSRLRRVRAGAPPPARQQVLPAPSRDVVSSGSSPSS
jgi:hypothetical protein